MTEIQYHKEIKLSTPDGIATDSIRVRITVTPDTAGCIIYGYDAAGNIQPVRIIGSGEVDLPFVNPQVYVKYVGEPTSFSLATLGWRHPRGQPRPPVVPPERQH